MTGTVFGEAAVIQVGWDGMLAMGGGICAGITAATRLVVNYLVARDKAEDARREEETIERQEGRLENRNQNNAILGFQQSMAQQSERVAIILSSLQGEVTRMVDRLDRLDPGSKEHRPQRQSPPRAQDRPPAGG